MNVLKNMEKIGEWKLEDGSSSKIEHLKHLKKIKFSINKNLKNIVYIFTINKEMVYIGETHNLEERMRSYQYGNSKKNDTDNRVKIELTIALVENKNVEIYYVNPIIEYEFNEKLLSLSLSKPIEKYLISEYSPKLNIKDKLK